MAYENGYEVAEYIGNTIDKYREDRLIFSKALQILQVFISRSDWPYCFDELDTATSLILGQPISSLIFGFTQKYLEDENMKRPEEMPSNFREELKSFHLATNHYVEQYWMGRINPSKLFSVARSTDYYGKQTIRFIRYDGQSVDFTMENVDIKHLISTLNTFLEGRN